MAEMIRIARAIVSNQIARYAPGAYVRLVGETGRGASTDGPPEIAAYFKRCFYEYFEQLGVRLDSIDSLVEGKVMLEYGPGDLPAVAALMVAHGAQKVYCVDQFPLIRLSAQNVAAMRALSDGLAQPYSTHLQRTMRDAANVAAGFDPSLIEYLVTKRGLCGFNSQVDLVFSRAVLEHVTDLDATLADMVHAMRPGATAIHLVDLRSHGLHRSNPLDFLTWSEGLWRVMHSAKGFPNRLRIDRYRDALACLPVDIVLLEPTHRASMADVKNIRSTLAAPFRKLSDDDLACLGFWLVFRKRASDHG